MKDVTLGTLTVDGGIKMDTTKEFDTLKEAAEYARANGYTHVYSYMLDAFIPLQG